MIYNASLNQVVYFGPSQQMSGALGQIDCTALREYHSAKVLLDSYFNEQLLRGRHVHCKVNCKTGVY